MAADETAGRARDAGMARRLLGRGPGMPGDGAGRWDERSDTSDRRGIEAVIEDCGVYEDGHRLPGRIPLNRAAEAARGTSGFVWIGLTHPTAEDIATIADVLGLPSLAVEDAVTAHQRPKLDVYDDMVFMVLKPVRYVDHQEVVDVSEIALFIGPTFVVTVRHGHSDVMRRVRAEFDGGGSGLVSRGPKAVLYRTADLVVDGYEAAITSITEDIDEIESQVFGADEGDHAERIYKLKREVAEFRRAALPLATPLQRLAEGSVRGVDKDVAPYFRDVYDHALRVADAIEGHDRLLSDVLQADLARVGARHSKIAVRQNEDMRRISAWAAIALAPTAIAGIYGMNFEFMPLLTRRYGYFVILGVIGAVCLGLYRLFRRSGWL